MSQKLARQSLAVMEVLAAADPATFGALLATEGLRVVATRERDPLVNRALPEDVEAVAAIISESLTERNPTNLDRHQLDLLALAEDYHYVVGVVA